MTDLPLLDLTRLTDSRLVWCAEGPYEPGAALIRYLREQPPTASSPVHLVFGVRRTPLPEEIRSLDHLTFGSTMPGRGLSGVPDLAYHRLSYHETSTLVLSRRIEVAAFIAVGSRVGHGAYSLGSVNGYMSALAATAGQVFIEAAPWLPHVRGAALVPEPAAVTPTFHERGVVGPGFSGNDPEELDRRIAQNAARCIPAGATISFGIGRIVDALPEVLAGRRDLAYVGGVVQNPVREMATAGMFAKRRLLTTAVVGGDDLLLWAAQNERLRLEPSALLHDPAWLSDRQRFSVILGGVEVDFDGAVNSEVSRGRLVSGVGGAPDFAAGGSRSSGGRTIVVMRSRRRDGSPALVSRLPFETIPGALVSDVVTEHGSADLTGLRSKDRATVLRRLFRVEG